MSTITIANGTEINVTAALAPWQFEDIGRATSAESDRAEELAGDESLWAEYIDPDNSTPFESETSDNRIALALLAVVANR